MIIPLIIINLPPNLTLIMPISNQRYNSAVVQLTDSRHLRPPPKVWSLGRPRPSASKNRSRPTYSATSSSSTCRRQSPASTTTRRSSNKESASSTASRTSSASPRLWCMRSRLTALPKRKPINQTRPNSWMAGSLSCKKRCESCANWNRCRLRRENSMATSAFSRRPRKWGTQTGKLATDLVASSL